MARIAVVFPHQLFERNKLIELCDVVYLVEEYLFFKQYKFHKRKIALHRAAMKFYQDFLLSRNVRVVYIDSFDELSDVRKLIPHLKADGNEAIDYIDTTDFWLEKRISIACEQNKLQYNRHSSPLFLNSVEDLSSYFADKKRIFQTDFYKQQRIQRSILLDDKKKPVGGKWTFDDENRLKYPKAKPLPIINFPAMSSYHQEAIDYVNTHFSENYGQLDLSFVYPATHNESRNWLKQFLETRFASFGDYEDAIVSNEVLLHHSMLTPMLNMGLITPQLVIDEAINYASIRQIPLNSLEGFIRQILGWREFIRAVYESKGSEERTKNYWGFTRKIPKSFWNGTTGIEPLDNTIKKVIKTGYCHHIERLMVIGNFMLLCEFDPDEVYQWFMELFIDSYDWVMVPNVYGMSQFADGGLMATKPYISGSNYLMKMSDFKKGDWQNIWDGLFWRFMHVHRHFFLQNPRLGMLVGTFDKMSDTKRLEHLNNAENYLNSL